MQTRKIKNENKTQRIQSWKLDGNKNMERYPGWPLLEFSTTAQIVSLAADLNWLEV